MGWRNNRESNNWRLRDAGKEICLLFAFVARESGSTHISIFLRYLEKYCVVPPRAQNKVSKTLFFRLSILLD